MFKSKLLYKIVFIFIITFIGFMISIASINFPKINNIVYSLEENNAKNILSHIFDITHDSAKSIQEYEKVTINEYKNNIKKNIAIVYNIFEHYNNLYINGKISLIQAKKEAFKITSTLKYDKDGYVFILDNNYKILSHINPKLVNVDSSKFQDVDGKFFAKEMIDNARLKGESYTYYWWKKPTGNISKKLSYNKKFAPWNIYIGTGIYLDDIEAKVKKLKNDFIIHLRAIVQHTKIGREGYVYIFDKKSKMIIHPNSDIEGKFINKLKNPSTSNSIFDDLVKASKTDKILLYKWDKPTDRGNFIYNKISWIDYEQYFGFYIVSSAYSDEFYEVSNNLKSSIMKHGIMVLLLFLFLSYLLIKKILFPLEQLSEITNEIANGHYDHQIQNTNNDEIGILTDNINSMAQTIKQHIKGLDKTIEEKIEQNRTQNEAFENMFQQSPDGLLIIEDGKFTNCNEAIIKMLNYKNKEELINIHPSQLSPKYQPNGEESFTKANEMMKLALQKGTHSFEWVHIRANGEAFWAHITLTSMILDNRKVIYVIWRDIDDQKKLKIELEELNSNLELKVQSELEKNRQKEKQLFEQSKLAQMGEMMGNIAHQWRQPLSAISSLSSSAIVQRELGILDNNELDNIFNQITKHTEYLSNTIEDFRDFFKMDKKATSIDIQNIINKTVSIVKDSYTSKQINIIISTSDEIIVQCLPSELSQVFLNILNNARDAFEEKEELEKKNVQIRYYKTESNTIKITFKDNAGGIPESVLPKIFNPYYTTKHQSQGTGIGLYMSKDIISQHHHGSIICSNYSNDEEKGAIFSIEIPLLWDSKITS